VQSAWEYGVRLPNGVKRRVDGRGDAWANAHRNGLGRKHYMNDVDALFGMEVWGANTGERLFMEYEPDNYQNRDRLVRTFAYVGMFDRKSSIEAAHDPRNRVSLAVYLDMARRLSMAQPKPMRFFFVIGGQSAPWLMVEHDIRTGKECGERVWIESQRDFATMWNRLGLTQLRQTLRRWVLAA